MPIVQQGSINTTALIVPDLYVQIVPPQNLVINGVPTNVVGVAGTASWGPVGEPVIVGSMSDYAASFGPVVARKHDMGTQVATAVQQGAADFRCVRVTDGTDTAAAFMIPTTGFILTALYTGSRGNQIAIAMAPGSRAARVRTHLLSQKMTVAASVMAPMKMSAHLSYRVAMRLQSLSLAKRFSIGWRCR